MPADPVFEAMPVNEWYAFPSGRLCRLKESSLALIAQARARCDWSAQAAVGIRWMLEAMREDAVRRRFVPASPQRPGTDARSPEST